MGILDRLRDIDEGDLRYAKAKARYFDGNRRAVVEIVDRLRDIDEGTCVYGGGKWLIDNYLPVTTVFVQNGR